jgi:hypothetical protein
MSESATSGNEPLWLARERKLAELSAADLEPASREQTVHKVASALDEAGYPVSGHATNMLELRAAMKARTKVGRPFLADFDGAVGALTLDDLQHTYAAAATLALELGETWPKLTEASRRRDIIAILEAKKLDLLVDAAKAMEGDRGVRFLIEKEIDPATIVSRLGITDERYAEVTAAIAAEKAEAARVKGLLDTVADTSPVEQAKLLINKKVTDENIVAMGGLDQAAIDTAREEMAEELREQQRREEEAAAARKAAAEGPALDAIPPEEMLEHIESIREIMEFSDKEEEIRQMCEQSSIPKSLVDVAVSDPDKLDELEAAAEG